MKASVALSLLCLTLPILFLWNGTLASWKPPTDFATVMFLISGALGLGIGDLFLLGAFIRIGVSRTLMLYGFQPLILGAAGFLFFDQSFDSRRWIAIAFLIGCLLIFSLERYRETKSWEFTGLAMAIIGVTMDSGGVLITRLAFEDSPATHPLEGHFVRCLGALIAYAFVTLAIKLHRVRRDPNDRRPIIGILPNFFSFDRKSRALILLGCFGGTYLSLCLYLTAIQIGHLASISAIAITGPMFAALLEAVIHKRRPTIYLLFAFLLFIGGFTVLIT